MLRLCQFNRASFSTAAATTRRPLFDKILVANRGEIACRVMRTAHKLGIRTVAVFSDADRHAMHVAMADEAFHIGPAPSADSYLQMDTIINVAKQANAQAIHPGYGFLSENPFFAEKLHNEKITFVGPPASAIRAMGSKSESKKIMQAANVPVVPGYHGDNQDPKYLKEQAGKIGYPVLIKAVKGGGGKGMRIVESPSDFDVMLESSRREAKKAFGDDRVLVEKYLVTPRHVEVQVFADTFGNAVYLFERDCSVQRRHQKIIEEAPAPGLSPELRRSLGEKAVAAAKAVNYVGAGTVEFIMDNTDNKFYFMEMNTRLQATASKIVFSLLVTLEVAAGNRLPLLQDDIKLTGHAFEARIYAENPRNQFLPDIGPLLHMSTPQPSDVIRVETGVRQGDQVSVYYDPMIAKLVVHGDDRTEALRRLRKALGEYQVVGLNTNIDFLKTLASHPKFIEAELETGFIKVKKYESDLFPPLVSNDPVALAQATMGLILNETQSSKSQDPWDKNDGKRFNLTKEREFVFTTEPDPRVPDKKPEKVHVKYSYTSEGKGSIDVALADSKHRFDNVVGVVNEKSGEGDSASLRLTVDMPGRRHTVQVVLDEDRIHVFNEDGKSSFARPDPAYLVSSPTDGSSSSSTIKSPMPSKISQLHVKPGDRVEKGQPIVVLEAMKMEHVLRAPFSGTVDRVSFKVGDLVEDNKVLVTFQEKESGKE